MPACEETGLESEMRRNHWRRPVHEHGLGLRLRNFLTREFDDGENAIDDYLRRRG